MGDRVPSPVAYWLEGIGLGRYAPVFVENGIDFDALPRLSEEHLTELGVRLPHRKELLAAIANLKTARVAPAVLSSPERLLHTSAERRQVTVLMCDVVGSTELSSRLDPEDLRAVMRLYQQTCREVVARHDGLIAQYRGDGVMVFFGYPRASEDAAESAVRCALDIISAMDELEPCGGGRIGVRLGLATGIAVLGDIVGTGPAEHFDVTGQVPNLAARIEGIAPPGTVAIADTTKKLVRDLFECIDLGLQRFKGIDHEVRVWQVIGERDHPVRFEGLHGRHEVGLVARERELALLGDRWRSAIAGQGQVVLLSGEPGMGKSRLVQHFIAGITGPDMVRVSVQCSARHGDSPLFPLNVHMMRAVGFDRNDSPAVKLQKIHDRLARDAGPDAVPLLAPLLSVPLTDQYRPLSMPVERMKALTLALLADLTFQLSDHRPLLLLLEDAHWIDPTTEELAHLIVQRIPDKRVLAIVTGRPEYRPSWASSPHVTALPLDRLEPHQAEELVSQIAAGRPFPGTLFDEILLKTDGVPLFIEELTKAVLEAEATGPAGRNGGASAPAPIVPATLQDSLMARLDRLGPIKHIAQVGAAISRKFSFAMLAEVVKKSPDELSEALERLVAAELIYQRGSPPDAVYTFKHALVQDVAYGSLLRASKKAIHAEIADVIETHFPEVLDAEPEALAHHWSCADVPEKAAPYWLKAAQRAIGRSANVEALRHLKNAIAVLDRIPETDGRALFEFNLHLAFGQASYVVNGPAHSETVDAFMRAQQQVEAVQDADQRYALLYGMFSSYHFASRFDLAEQPAQRTLTLASRQSDAGHTCLGHRMLGYLCFFRGDLSGAVEHFRMVEQLYVPELHGRLAALHGCDSRGGTSGFWVVADGICGRPETALRRNETNIAFARQLGHSGTVGWALTAPCYLHFFLQDREAALPVTAEGLTYCRQNNVGTWAVHCRVFNAWARAHVADPGACVDEIRGAIADAGSRISLGIPLFRGVLADVLLAAGRIPEAIAEADEALRETVSLNQTVFEPIIHEIRGRGFLRQPQPDLAEAAASFRRSAAAARRMDARLLELRAATRLADIGGESAELGRTIIAEIYPLFTEGFESRDLRAARAYLAARPQH
jgi:class 3 adenylate cyclase/tetratricopeptide (TPR) repeat protein